MAEFKLSLIQRKNLKENEEKLQENLQAIKDVTGKDDWTMEIDWGTCYPVMQLGDTPGSTIYNYCMTALAENIKKLCSNETAKESFVEAMSASKIIFTVDKKASSYWSEKINNGCLELGYKGSVCNTSYLGTKIEELLTTTFEDNVMSVILRKNIAENEEKFQEHVAKISEATGRDFTLTIQWPEMLKDHLENNHSSFGSSLYDYCFGGLAENIKKLCSNEFGKEAFNNFATSGNIIFNSNKTDKKATGYYKESFVNGDLVVTFRSICNTSYIGSKIEEILTIEFEEVTMPLVLRKNIEENEEKFQEHVAKLNEVTGRDFTLKIQWPEMLKDHLENNHSSFGSSLYDYCFGGLVSNIKKVCEDETYPGKDAFNEFATSGTIIFNSNKTDKKAPSGYHFVKFDNGDIVVTFKSICNTSYIGSNLADLLTVTHEEQVVPYVLKRSLVEKEEKLQENMEIINTATGKTFELQVDWVKMLPFLKDVNKTDNSSVGSTLYDSVMSGLASNIKKLCADELGQEGFIEACTTCKIILTVEEDKKASGYYNEKFVNGDLVISFKSICNCSYIGQGIEKLL